MSIVINDFELTSPAQSPTATPTTAPESVASQAAPSVVEQQRRERERRGRALRLYAH